MTPWRTQRRSPRRAAGNFCFNAATAMTPWRTAARAQTYDVASKLQCGHGDDAVENQADPRHEGDDVLCFNAATAMTPWRTNKGLDAALEDITLQCGHGDDAVENKCSRPSTRQSKGCF